MGSVTVLNLEVVCEASGHQAVPMGPNVCTTPAAPSPIPIPYPIMGSSSTLDPGTENTLIDGKKTLNAKSKVKQVMGNQAGSIGDITTGTTGGTAWALGVPAVTVHFEGAPIAVTGTPGFGNSN